MGKADRLIRNLLASRERRPSTRLVREGGAWSDVTEPTELTLARRHRVYVEGDEAWHVPDHPEAMFAVRCLVLGRDHVGDAYVVDEPTQPLRPAQMYFDLPSAIDGLERKWLRAVHTAVMADVAPTGYVVEPVADITLELSLPRVACIDLDAWRTKLACAGDLLELVPKSLGVDWFQASNFVASRG